MKELYPQRKNLQFEDSPQSFWYSEVFFQKKRNYFEENFGVMHGYLLHYSPVEEAVSPFSALLHWAFVLIGK